MYSKCYVCTFKTLEFVVSKSTAIMIRTAAAYNISAMHPFHLMRFILKQYFIPRDALYCYYHGIMNQNLCIPVLFFYILGVSKTIRCNHCLNFCWLYSQSIALLYTAYCNNGVWFYHINSKRYVFGIMLHKLA